MTRWGSRLGNENEIHAELRQNELESDQSQGEGGNGSYIQPGGQGGCEQSPARELGLMQRRWN